MKSRIDGWRGDIGAANRRLRQLRIAQFDESVDEVAQIVAAPNGNPRRVPLEQGK